MFDNLYCFKKMMFTKHFWWKVRENPDTSANISNSDLYDETNKSTMLKLLWTCEPSTPNFVSCITHEQE